MSDEFDKAFEEAARDLDFTPNFEASWRQVEKKLKRRRRRGNRLRMLPYVGAAFLLGAFLFGTPTFSRAFSPFFENLRTVQDGIVHLVVGSEPESATTKPKTAPPPDYQPPSQAEGGKAILEGTSTNVTFDNWEEAAKNVVFRPPTIGYVPSGYRLDRVMESIPPQKDKANLAALIYSRTDKDSGGYTITVKQIATGEKISSDYDEKDGTLEIVKIGGNQAYLFLTKDGSSSLEYRYESLYVFIVGDLDREQILEVGKQIRWS